MFLLLFILLSKIFLKSLYVWLDAFISHFSIRTMWIMHNRRKFTLWVIFSVHSSRLLVLILYLFELLLCNFSAYFLLRKSLPQYRRYYFDIPLFQLLLCFYSIFDSLILHRIGVCALNIDCVEIAMKVYIIGYPILVGIFFRIGQ